MNSHQRDSGFTIIELLVVIAVVGVVATLAIPSFVNMIEMTKLRTATSTIQRQLTTARSRAIADPYVHCGVYFDVTPGNYRSFIFFDKGTPYTVDASDTVLKYGGVFSLPKGDTLKVPLTGGITNQIVVFRGDGSAKNGGSITIINKNNVRRTVSVLASTGRVKVQ